MLKSSSKLICINTVAE